MRGKHPYWPDNLMKRHIRPIAKSHCIHKRIGCHTFRHTFGALLKANGEDVKTVKNSYGIRTVGSRLRYTRRRSLRKSVRRRAGL
jgi:site-specific recombinase XerD